MYELMLPERARPVYRLSQWKAHVDERAGALVARGYASSTVGCFLRQWVSFVREQEGEGIVLPSDVRDGAVRMFLDGRWKTGSARWRFVRRALRHLLSGAEVVRRVRTLECGAISALFDAHVPDYLAFARQHRGCGASRHVKRVLQEFFKWIDGRGMTDVGTIGPGELRDFLASREGLKRTTVAAYASILRVFFRYLGMSGKVRPGLDMSIESPRLYRMSSPPPVLAEEVVERLVAAANRKTPIGRRDYAMLLLAVRYGMRPCDIRGLRLDDIRWREQRLVLLQSKTQRALELPLVADVDEALVDYLRNGRPACDVREVFVRHSDPVRSFGDDDNLWRVMQGALKAAGIEPPSGRHGLYLLRHSAATRMLGKGVPFDTISDVLGHASVETTRVYAQVDLKGLRSVALSAGEVCA